MHIYIHTYIYTYIYIYTHIHICNTPKGLYTQSLNQIFSTNWNAKQFRGFQRASPRMDHNCWLWSSFLLFRRRQEGLSACLVLPWYMRRLNSLQSLHLRLSPLLDHTAANAWLYSTSLPVYLKVSRYHSSGEDFLADRSLKAKAAGITVCQHILTRYGRTGTGKFNAYIYKQI